MNTHSQLPTPHFSPFRIPHSALRTGSAAFTLIELLVVIGIIALLASLIVGGAGIATTKMRRARVETERDALITAIESYHKSKGYFPPDNPNTTNTAILYPTYQNTLFYELTGVNVIGNPPTGFTAIATQEKFTLADVASDFSVGGFMNVPTSESSVTIFYKGMKANQHTIVQATNAPGTYTVLGIGVAGPLQLSPAPGTTGFPINPWHYVVSNPTNNTGSFDLWMDVAWAGKTNRISNWSKDPQVVAY